MWVATGADGQIAGVLALDLNKLFVEPRHIRGGDGRTLPAARGCRGAAARPTILADPNAADFYERNGAARIGEVPSDAVPGRLLLLYELGLIPRGPS